MKKLAIMVALTVAMVSASAVEIGIRGIHNDKSSADLVGVTVGQKYGNIGVEGSFDRSTRGPTNVNRLGFSASYDVATVYGLTFAPKVGVALVDPSVSHNSTALLAGVELSYPLLKNVTLVGNYTYQHGQGEYNVLNGNAVSAGVKYSF